MACTGAHERLQQLGRDVELADALGLLGNAAKGLGDELLSQLQTLPDHDAQLASALAASNGVLGFAAERRAASTDLPLSRFGLVSQGPSPLPFLPSP